jgi:hypothetical protein
VFGGDPSESLPEELRAAINAVIAEDDRGVTDYILAPQRNLRTSAPGE